MRRQAFDYDGTGHAHAGFVVIGAVVEQFDIGGLGDGGVDLLLAGDASFPPFGVLRFGGSDPTACAAFPAW
jgi:hypothetical protein